MNKDLLNRLNSLPKSWNDVTLNDYNKLITAGVVATEYDEETSSIDIPLSIIATLTNTNIEELEEISYLEIAPYIQSLGWFYEVPVDAKITLKCRDVKEISYAEFVTFMQLKDGVYKYVNQLLPIFYPELEGEDLNTFSIPMINGFFSTAQRKLKKHFRTFQFSLCVAIVKKWLKEKVSKIFNRGTI